MVILFLMVVLPFMVLSITMGGVVMEQLVASVLGLLCYSFLLCQMGTFASTVASGNRRAFSLMTVLWFLFELGFLLLYIVAFFVQEQFLDSQLAAKITEYAGELRQTTLMMTLSDSQALNRGDDIWNRQMTFQLCAGCGFFALSWISFELFNKRAIAQGVSQESPHRVLEFFSRNRRSERVWGDALVWKSWQFLGGGWPWFLIRLLVIPMFVGMVVLFVRYGVGESIEAEVVVGTLMVISGPFSGRHRASVRNRAQSGNLSTDNFVAAHASADTLWHLYSTLLWYPAGPCTVPVVVFWRLAEPVFRH